MSFSESYAKTRSEKDQLFKREFERFYGDPVYFVETILGTELALWQKEMIRKHTQMK